LPEKLSLLSFQLSADTVVVNDTVRLNVSVVAMISKDQPDDAVKADIKAMMKALVDTDWSFSNMVRAMDQSGLERLTVSATARVPEAENVRLDERARAVSREGLRIVSISPDTSVPKRMVQEAESKLRVELMKRAHDEAQLLSREAPPKGRRVEGDGWATVWVVHEVDFHRADHHDLSSKSVTAQAGMAYGHASETIGNAERLSMTASVALRAE
jgi:hypothetical protein